ncbi:hypothetical protein CETAM_05975 [Corynebacterium comes]|uniref:HNH nuclease domain-containing protein n=1 Tax=Corynebacterium comes TaxID=2675218 RepID=A0A6B8VGP1_9CORY|nr:hypothetical protein CETAM_05975 [Corynebacterium comes]
MLADAVDETVDCDVNYAAIVRSTGLGSRTVERNLMAMATLDELPALRAHHEQLHHLDLARLRAVESALAMADRAYFPELDERITRYLTATRPHQPLPSPKSIRKRIKAMLDELDASLATDEEDPELPGTTYSMKIHDDGTADLFARFDAPTAAAIDARVRALAEERRIGHAAAHALLLTGEDAGVKVHMNLYRAHDVEEAPVYLPRAGWLNPRRSAEWLARASTVRDMDEAATFSTDAYRTPAILEALLEGRDDVCRYPGCPVPAQFCDNDHMLNHADGGTTSADNLVNLCRHHHNLKTAGHIRYVLDAVTGHVIWLLPNGEWVEDIPEGPLTTDSRRWVQTFVQRRDARNERARLEAQARKRLRDELLEKARDTPDEGDDATGGGEDEGDVACPWSADLLTEPDADPQTEGHTQDPDGPDEPVGLRQ